MRYGLDPVDLLRSTDGMKTIQVNDDRVVFVPRSDSPLIHHGVQEGVRVYHELIGIGRTAKRETEIVEGFVETIEYEVVDLDLDVCYSFETVHS